MRAVVGKIVACIFAVCCAASGQVPRQLLGEWLVGKSYDTVQPVGIDQSQANRIEAAHLLYTHDHLRVCGKDIPIESVSKKSLNEDAFVQATGFSPSFIGFKGTPVVEVSLNGWESTNACGDFLDPGVDVFIGPDSHVVIEVENAYFPLRRGR